MGPPGGPGGIPGGPIMPGGRGGMGGMPGGPMPGGGIMPGGGGPIMPAVVGQCVGVNGATALPHLLCESSRQTGTSSSDSCAVALRALFGHGTLCWLRGGGLSPGGRIMPGGGPIIPIPGGPIMPGGGGPIMPAGAPRDAARHSAAQRPSARGCRGRVSPTRLRPQAALPSSPVPRCLCPRQVHAAPSRCALTACTACTLDRLHAAPSRCALTWSHDAGRAHHAGGRHAVHAGRARWHARRAHARRAHARRAHARWAHHATGRACRGPQRGRRGARRRHSRRACGQAAVHAPHTGSSPLLAFHGSPTLQLSLVPRAPNRPEQPFPGRAHLRAGRAARCGSARWP
jgi:hypothetical protein